MGKLRLFVDRMSQPSRAVLIFCLANGIDLEEHLVNLAKGEHRKAEFKLINPMCQVPAMDDNGFHLFESHAMLKYLVCTYPNIKDHWYPADLRKRAQIDCILDWHHSGLRRGSAGLVMNSVIAPVMGRKLDPQAAAEAEALLKASLGKIETVWLTGNGKFLTGSLQPSIADLSLACEVMQLQLLGKAKFSDLLDSNPKVKNWLAAVERTLSPHFSQVHDIIWKAATMYENKREREARKADGTISKL
ncbi:hypothetical protein KP509_32G056700 [Ceratopteris richardii]|uniref:Uncharacterized protein n=1 Tax=Ceratopteris richardii TaxID=49495 RepID=A0A8T2QU22_CERRI|nr:hypothetical protein KP509_32G056700 [Ceratopteris richardii]KAH7287447.1 hypothetical protein KP509_32G056700 [Ceratopteris richardii]